MSLQKTSKLDNPHAVLVDAQGWVYLVLKTYQKPAKEGKSQFARWMVAVSSPFTHGSFEIGDTYIFDILPADLVAATPEWLQAYSLDKPTVTPQQWFVANDVDPTR